MIICYFCVYLSIVFMPNAGIHFYRLHEIATDCVCSAMIMLEAERIPTLAEVLFAGVLQLGDPYHMAVALEDINAITNYAR